MPPNTMPHPAERRHPHFLKYLWRYFSGHHLDGIPRTNAGWFTRGISPSHQANWWTSKPRFYRMLWRWALVIIPIAFIAAVHYAPYVEINTAYGIFLMFAPYLFHHGVSKVIGMLPHHTLVYVHDNVKAEEANPELHEVALPEQFDTEDDSGLQDLYDVTIEDDNGTRGKRRRS